MRLGVLLLVTGLAGCTVLAATAVAEDSCSSSVGYIQRLGAYLKGGGCPRRQDVPFVTRGTPTPPPVSASKPGRSDNDDRNPFNAGEGQTEQTPRAPLKSNATPNPPAAPTYIEPAPVYLTPSNHTFGSPVPSSAPVAPGGIALSKAAASRMPLNIALDGLYYKNGRLVLAGRDDSEHILDGALLLTALRAACETKDPYFSLDLDDGPAWGEEGELAIKAIWDMIKGEIAWGQPVKANSKTLREHSLSVRNIWVQRDYPQLWNQISFNYPNLQSRLIFRPSWLRETRFGDILYRADVLLKELAAGASILEPGPLRAANIDGYISATGRGIAHRIVAATRGEKTEQEVKSSRLWFDIAPRSTATDRTSAWQAIESSADPQLLATLKKSGLVSGNWPHSPPAAQLVKDGDTLDLTSIYPTMFVRRHDFVAREDLPDDDPILNAFSNDINDKIEHYTNHYKELKELTAIVRAYVASVHITNQNSSICQKLRQFELLDSEKIDPPQPVLHSSELFISVARYASGTGRAVRTYFTSFNLVQGGVTISGKLFHSAARTAELGTPIIRALKAEVAQHPQNVASSWTGQEGRHYIALVLDADNFSNSLVAGQSQLSSDIIVQIGAILFLMILLFGWKYYKMTSWLDAQSR